MKAMKYEEINQLRTSGESSPKMPVLFIGHGSPMNAIEENEYVKTWRGLGASMTKPRAILCISAHWETKGTYVTAMPKPQTIHDFGGFPKELYEVQYPAPGSPELAYETKHIITNTEVGLDGKWGLDHGAWSVIRRIYPEADVPVIEMSLDYSQSPLYHYELGKELSALRNKGILIIGSGNMVHNLRMVAWDKVNEPEYGFDWAIQANEKFKQLISSGNHKDLINYTSLGREVQLAIPTPEHYLPLLYTLALKEKDEVISFFNDKPVMGSLTMTSIKVG
jgi:4,5-DOPA dioxygenase extradiol